MKHRFEWSDKFDFISQAPCGCEPIGDVDGRATPAVIGPTTDAVICEAFNERNGYYHRLE